MNRKVLFILSMFLAIAIFAGCEPVQQNNDTDSVPIDNIPVEDGMDKGDAHSDDSMMDDMMDMEDADDMKDEDMSDQEDLSSDATNLPECNDGIDNDGDGAVDFDDFGCDAPEDNNEVNNGDTRCTDGLDNDGDGLVDQDDPGCPTREGPSSEDASDEAVSVEETPQDDVPQTTSKEIVILVEETELVKLSPVARDPDSDRLSFTYTTPLDDTGEWQTTYGDEGQYTVTITASDGELTSSKDALVIVSKKEESPTIDFMQPDSIEQNINENTQLDFRISASDLNSDPLTISWRLDGEEVSVSDRFTYDADFNSAGAHTLKVEVTDGTSVASMLWSITVNNVDRPPVLAVIPDVTLRETEALTIRPEATDPDGDNIVYTIEDPVGDDGFWETTYDDAGVYTIRVSASDGELEDSQDVKVTVINVNRAPVIDDIIQVE